MRPDDQQGQEPSKPNIKETKKVERQLRKEAKDAAIERHVKNAGSKK
jgi:hypothetical protein